MRAVPLFLSLLLVTGVSCIFFDPDSPGSSRHAPPAESGLRKPELARSAQGMRLQITGWGREVPQHHRTFDLEVEAAIDFGWHIYSMYDQSGYSVPTKITLGQPADGAPAFALAGPVQESKPKQAKGPFDETILEHVGKATFQLTVTVPEGIAAGSYELPVTFVSGACDINGCDPPEQLDLKLPITVRGKGTR